MSPIFMPSGNRAFQWMIENVRYALSHTMQAIIKMKAENRPKLTPVSAVKMLPINVVSLESIFYPRPFWTASCSRAVFMRSVRNIVRCVSVSPWLALTISWRNKDIAG